ncbi:uncharacterized protein P884DRAFT_293214 [Thermothelomyces heterothallicus CBS 202.75]|uniref:uncharacterized protein n=1 Tax=Thermothelomyces heterothallicus CBS 202.75 TaxID=1149848 RepID=UPI0037430511
MAPSANTAKQRRAPGNARLTADSDSDAEYQAYNGRLQQASAARARLRKARETRDKNRAALATAYDSSLERIVSRAEKSIAKYHDLQGERINQLALTDPDRDRMAIRVAHLRRLKQAVDRRDEKTGQIARKLAEHQRRMLNLAIQLQALYEGRMEDVAALLEEGGGGGGGAAAAAAVGGAGLAAGETLDSGDRTGREMV